MELLTYEYEGAASEDCNSEHWIAGSISSSGENNRCYCYTDIARYYSDGETVYLDLFEYCNITFAENGYLAESEQRFRQSTTDACADTWAQLYTWGIMPVVSARRKWHTEKEPFSDVLPSISPAHYGETTYYEYWKIGYNNQAEPLWCEYHSSQVKRFTEGVSPDFEMWWTWAEAFVNDEGFI